MRTIPWVHSTGVEMYSWVTIEQVVRNVESIINEDIVEFDGVQDSIDFIYYN